MHTGNRFSMGTKMYGGQRSGYLLCWNIGLKKIMSAKKKIMLFADWYEPGFKAGGPIRSCVNFVEYMHAAYDIFIFTSDRDLNAAAAYENIATDQWQKKTEGVSIYYCSPQKLTWRIISKRSVPGWSSISKAGLALSSAPRTASMRSDFSSGMRCGACQT